MNQREIKFRVRSKATNLIVGYEALFPTDVKNTQFEWAQSADGINWTEGVIQGKNFQREQFTGLHDKNGKEIWEGDILSNDAGAPKMTVMFNRGCFTLEGINCLSHTQVGTGWLDNTKFLEVIGNIYEHGHLLQS